MAVISSDPYIDYLFRFTGTTRRADALATLREWLRDDPSQEDGIAYDRSMIQRFQVITTEGTDTDPPVYAPGLFVQIALTEIRPEVRDIPQCLLVLSRQRALDGLNPVLLNRSPVAVRSLRFEPVFAGVAYSAIIPS